ncbi:MAG: hypothetical protein ACRCZF_07370 [Gemmataceae bacterium]
MNHLPPVCVCCGATASHERRQEFRLANKLSGAVLAASVLAGGLAWTEQSITLFLPVCARHQKPGYKSNQTFFRGSLITIILGLAAYAAFQFEGPVGKYLVIGAIAAGIGTVVAAMNEVDDGLKVRSLTPEAITLTGVHRAFAAALAPSSV